MKTILITGINGFLGSSLAKNLINDFLIIGLEKSRNNNFRIRDLDVKSYSLEFDNPESIFSEQKIDIIIHTATEYGKKGEDPVEIAKSNMIFPLQILDLAITNKCDLFVNTDTILNRFTNYYALTKSHFQEWLYLRSNEIKTINMRLEHFYGPGAGSQNFVIQMIEQMRRNEPSINLTLGEQKRDFIYIDDVVSAYKIILFKSEELNGKYNDVQVASMDTISIKELVHKIKDLTQSSSVLNFGAIKYRENELMTSESDNSLIKSLGWIPRVNLNEGLRRMVQILA
jgi:nucleoside-diphosphate-sugar epimerase